MRPELQLFLHVLGAIALFGSFATLGVLAFAGRRLTEGGLLAKAALVTTIAVGVPAWALTLIFGSWTKANEGLPGTVGWIRAPSAIAFAGMFVLLGAAAISYSWLRRPAGWQAPALGLVSGAYIVALSVAWWMMTAKVG
jgi:hypothetical protein